MTDHKAKASHECGECGKTFTCTTRRKIIDDEGTTNFDCDCPFAGNVDPERIPILIERYFCSLECCDKNMEKCMQKAREKREKAKEIKRKKN